MGEFSNTHHSTPITQYLTPDTRHLLRAVWPTPYTLIFLLLLLALFSPLAASAHPMGNFSINHYSRMEAEAGKLHVRYILDFAEIPTVTERDNMDSDRNGQIYEAEKKSYLLRRGKELAAGLSLSVNGDSAPMQCSPESVNFLPGAGGLQTLRVSMSLTATLPDIVPGKSCKIEYKDSNYSERAGWKEIVTTASGGVKLTSTTGAANDTSKELTLYPINPLTPQPQLTGVEFILAPDASSTGKPFTPSQAANSNNLTPSANSRTPQDAFTQSISSKDLSAGIILLSLGLAFLFGAFHALAPGHGKAMVAAYLVGSRGTVKHAILLGAIITVTHTIGVFALGLITLAAAKYIVPERLYPILSGLSGLTIVIVGCALLWQRIHVSWPDSEEERGEFEDNTSAYKDEILSEEFDDAPVRNNGVSFKSLLALGITGGILPCPSALVVMLSAIALHRIAFGMLLIVAFSMGLAVVLTSIGILIVRMRGWFDRMPVSGKLLERLPIASAAIVTIIGLILIYRAFTGQI